MNVRSWLPQIIRRAAVFFLVALLPACAAELQLDRLKLPPGFDIRVFATVPRSRMLAFSPEGTLLVTATAAGDVLALPDPQHTGRALRPITVLSGLDLPHGIAFQEGKLFVAESEAVARYDWDERNLRATNRKVFARLPGAGEHFTRTLVFNDDKLYVSIGSDCNVCAEQNRLRAAVLEFTKAEYMGDSIANGQLVASGIRNAVGMAVNPKTRTVWVTENGRDNLGDDLPPDEINDLSMGKDFGWPYCYGNRVPDPAHKAEGEKRCPSTVPPVLNLQAHSAPLGLAFYAGNAFPPEYRNNLLVAFHGSWNRSVPTGYKIVRIPLNDKGQPQGKVEDFITGWLAPGQGRGSVMGRPVGIAFGPDGAMYISDDDAGVIYRVTYGK